MKKRSQSWVEVAFAVFALILITGLIYRWLGNRGEGHLSKKVNQSSVIIPQQGSPFSAVNTNSKAPGVSNDPNKSKNRIPANLPNLVSKVLDNQLTVQEISDKTKIPARTAAEVKFDIRKIKELSSSNAPFSIEILPGRFLQVAPSDFRFENEFHHVSGTVSTAVGADVTLTMDDGKILVGIIKDPPRAYQIVYSGHETSYVIEVDTDKNLPYFERDNIESGSSILRNLVPEGENGASVKPDFRESEQKLFVVNEFEKGKLPLLRKLIFGEVASAAYVVKDSNKKIRIYMVYNAVVRGANGGDDGTKAMIANQVAILNESMANSGISFRVEVSKYVFSDLELYRKFDDTNYSLPSDPNYYVTYPDGRKSEAHRTVENLVAQFQQGSANRNDVLNTASDIVHLWIAYQNSDATGRVKGLSDGWVSTTSGGASTDVTFSWNKPVLGAWGYAFSAMQNNVNYVFAHEIGHLFGLEHNIEHSGYYNSSTKTVSNLRYPGQYNFGFHNDAQKQKTIMSYDSTCGVTGFTDSNNQLTSMKTTCPVLKSFSAGNAIVGGLTANNKRKLQEIEAVLFSSNPVNLVELIPKGSTDSGSYNYLKAALKSPAEIPVTVKQGDKTINLITENKVALPTRPFMIYPGFFSSYVRTYKNGVLVVETNHSESSLNIASNPGFAKGDKIELRFENRFGYASARYVIADVHTPISLTVSKSSTNTVKSGTSVRFTASLSANPMPACKWFVNNADAGVSALTFDLTLSTNLSSELKTVEYRCTRNSLYDSNEVKTATASVTVYQLPVITTQPSNISLSASATSASLKVVATGAGLAYQWFKNNAAITNANSATLNLSGTPSSMGGDYYVRVSNPGGVVNSKTVFVYYFQPPTITLGVSEKVSINEGQYLALSAKVTGSPAPTVTWKFLNTQISSTASVTITGIKGNQSGDYVITASNTNPSTGAASTVTKTVNVSVRFKPVIIRDVPASIKLSSGSKLELSIEAKANPAPAYRWYFVNKNGVVQQTSVVSSNFSIASVDTNHEGSYYCEVSNELGMVQSSKSSFSIQTEENVEGSQLSFEGFDFSNIKIKTSGGFREDR